MFELPEDATDSEVRRTGIGGSDIAAIVNENPHATVLDVYRAKVEGLDKIENQRMKRGRQLERIVLDWYQEETLGQTAVQVGSVERMRHPSHAWWLGQPDALVWEKERAVAPGMNVVSGGVSGLLHARTGAKLVGSRPDWIVEAKTHGFYAGKGYGEDESDDVPRHYICQATWYLGLLGLKRCDFAVLMDTHDFHVYRVYRDDGLLATLLEAGQEFWKQHVEREQVPAPDGSDSRSRWIRERLRRSNGLAVRATDDQAKELAAIAKLKAQEKALAVEIKRRNQVLQEQVGLAAALVDADGKELVTWREDGRGKPDYKAITWRLAKRFGMTDAEADAVIDTSRLAANRPWKIKIAGE